MTTTTDLSPTTDRIVKQLEVRATRARVWRAISDASEFGAWFGVSLDAPFTVGGTVRGALTIPGYEHVMLEMRIERIEPEHCFAYRWHPYAADPRVDYSAEPTTLVEFRLEEHADGTTIVITESGFERLPSTRRVEAFRRNESGWTSQSKKLAAYVTR